MLPLCSQEIDTYHSPFLEGSVESAADEATDRALALALAEQNDELGRSSIKPGELQASSAGVLLTKLFI
jgi:hypothetical protein